MKLFINLHPMVRAFRRFPFAAMLAIIVGNGAMAQEWRPKDTIELIVPDAPGGANDNIARLIQKTLQDEKLVDTAINVLNKPSGNGNISLAYMEPRVGDAHYLRIASITLQFSQITGLSHYRYSDFTPIANMVGDFITFAVKTASDLKTAKDLMETLRVKPESLSVGVTAIGGSNHIPLVFMAKAVGADVRRVRTPVFNQPAVTALLGGHVDMMLGSVATVVPYVRAGSIRVLAVSSGTRLGGVLANVPTLKEVGVNFEFSNWRGLIGPKGLTPAQVAYWERRLAEVVKSQQWKATIEKNFWADDYMNSVEMKAYLDRNDVQLRAALSDIGMAK